MAGPPGQPAPFDFSAMLDAGARFAQARREAEAFKLRKEDRQYERDQAQKKLDFAEKVRGLVVKRNNAATPEERAKAVDEISVLSPDVATKLMGVDQDRVKLEADQFALQNKQQLDAALMVKQSLESFKAAPSYDTMKREINRMKLAQMRGVAIDPQVIAGFEATASAPDSPDFANFDATITRAADETISRLSPPPKAATPFRPGAPSLETLNYFTALPPSPGVVDPSDLLGTAGGPDVARVLDPPRWKLAQEMADKASASRGSIKIVNEAPRDPSTAEIPAAAKGRLMDKLDYVTGYLEKTQQIKKTIAPEYFGAEGAVKGFATKLVGYFAPSMMPDNWNDWVDAKRELQTFSTMSAYDIMVALSGKAITEPERKLLLAAAGDINTMTMREYQGAVDAMEKVMLFSKRRLERELTPGGGMEYVDDPGVQAWMDTKIEKIAKDQESGVIDDKETNKLLKKVQTDGLYRLMGVRARKRRDAGPVIETPENSPASATMKTPATRKPQKGDTGTAPDGTPIVFDGKGWLPR